nr:uncharacterized protein LOC106623454 isoform X2 [Bactrocera oleae]
MFGHSRSRFYMLPYYCSFDSKCFRSYVSCTLMESKQIIVARYCTTNKLSTKKDINNSNKQMFNIKNMFNNSTTDDSSDQQANSTYIKRVVVFLEEVLHMDDVRRAQEQVINIKIYTEIDELQKELAAVDGHEQYLFNAFSVAINDSYEKEKIYTNMIKILGIVGTLLGSFITFVLSVVGFLYNQRKFYTLRKDVQSALTDQVLHKLDKVIEDIKDFQQTVNVKQSMVLTEKPVESWGSYLNRNTRWIYGWALPKK